MTIKTAFIAEDEPLARETIRDAVMQRPELRLIGEAADGVSALAQINTLQPEVLFMDIQMPEMTGLEVLKRINYNPRIIFTTAYDHYAVAAFELNAIDYLLKPFTRERFNAAVDRLQESMDNASTDSVIDTLQRAAEPDRAPLQRILVKDRGHIFPVNVNDIAYLKSDAKYTGIYVGDKTYLVRLGLSELADRLDPQRFVRIHRSVMVNLDFVESMKADDQSQLQLHMRDGSVLLANRDASKMLRDMSI
jgi:two-component system LytT family response regulator